jgi:hypothetical protein
MAPVSHYPRCNALVLRVDQRRDTAGLGGHKETSPACGKPKLPAAPLLLIPASRASRKHGTSWHAKLRRTVSGVRACWTAAGLKL